MASACLSLASAAEEAKEEADRIESSSDYGDFTSDEEVILYKLLSQVTPTSLFTEQPLQVTDIEDYEEPKGVHLPKVLGFERRYYATVNQRKRLVPNLAERAGRIYAEPAAATQSGQGESTEKDDRPPIERFRRPPKKALSVTDLVSPAWCELQYFYTLAKHGRKKRTPAMKQGSSIHKALEDEVHTTVAIDITTKEDGWALRVWNVIQGLRTLRDTGRTRELEVWGLIGGEICNGIVDELSYTCPDPKLETERHERYAQAQSAKEALPEYQTSITDYLLTTGGGGGQSMSTTGNERSSDHDDDDDKKSMPPPPTPTPRNPREKFIYITDIKTRAARSLPAGASIRPTVMQLHLYHHMLENLACDNFPLQALADRYELDVEATLSDSFIAQVGSLNQDFFDAVSEQPLVGAVDAITAAASSSASYASLSSSSPQIASSQGSTELLLKHNTLHSLWSLMIQQFQQTFLLQPGMKRSNGPHHHHNHNHQQSTPSASTETRLSPILTATYLSSTTAALLGSRSMLFHAGQLEAYLDDNLAWWRGERAARGVELAEAWKCRSCDFRDDCSWIHERDAAAVAEVKARKKIRERAAGEGSPSKSEV